MRRSLALSISCAALGTVPALAAASSAEHGEAGLDWAYFLYHALGLAILLGVLVYFSRQPIKSFLLDRSDGIRRQIQGAKLRRGDSGQRSLEAADRRAACGEDHDLFVHGRLLQRRVTTINRV